ncbi:MAG: sugar phosphate isomerase/epimerase [Clostridia bacterium]|nr:sugar phosphate isomerase/epimerase [Clostridia bacterium]
MKIGAQMFTIREFCKTPERIIESLEKLAEIGYRYIQFSGCGPIDPHLLRDTCDRLGMELILTHSKYERIIDDTDNLIKEHDIYGSDYIGLGAMPQYARVDQNGLDAFMKVLEEPIQKIRAAGKRFGYHNHAFEFRKMKDDLIFNHLLNRFSADELGVILDTYWVQQGGADIYQWIDKLKGRLYCVHLKDQGVKEDGKSPMMMPIGEGNLNFPAIIKAFEEAGAEYAFVEQDKCNGEDPFECLRRSFEYLKSLGYC